MSKLIPFVSGITANKLARQYFADSEVRRIPIDLADKLKSRGVPVSGCWLDPAIDGLDQVHTRLKRPWYKYMDQNFGLFRQMGNPDFQAKPRVEVIQEFVFELLDKALEFEPAWLSVPSIPFYSGAGRNRINQALAGATREWVQSKGYTGKLILPVVAMKLDAIKDKQPRASKVEQAARCFEASGATGYWAVLKSLEDDRGSQIFRKREFLAVKRFHDGLNEKLAPETSVGGPYWGLNMILWARGRITHPAIGTGSGFQYSLSGGHAEPPTSRIALAPLYRRVRVTPDLKEWLIKVVEILPASHPNQAWFVKLLDRYSLLNDEGQARKQIVKYYRKWYSELVAKPQAERSSGLYSMLTNAFELGQLLPDLPSDETARRPEAVAESLMLSCFK